MAKKKDEFEQNGDLAEAIGNRDHAREEEEARRLMMRDEVRAEVRDVLVGQQWQKGFSNPTRQTYEYSRSQVNEGVRTYLDSSGLGAKPIQAGGMLPLGGGNATRSGDATPGSGTPQPGDTTRKPAQEPIVGAPIDWSKSTINVPGLTTTARTSETTTRSPGDIPVVKPADVKPADLKPVVAQPGVLVPGAGTGSPTDSTPQVVRPGLPEVKQTPLVSPVVQQDLAAGNSNPRSADRAPVGGMQPADVTRTVGTTVVSNGLANVALAANDTNKSTRSNPGDASTGLPLPVVTRNAEPAKVTTPDVLPETVRRDSRPAVIDTVGSGVGAKTREMTNPTQTRDVVEQPVKPLDGKVQPQPQPVVRELVPTPVTKDLAPNTVTRDVAPNPVQRNVTATDIAVKALGGGVTGPLTADKPVIEARKPDQTPVRTEQPRVGLEGGKVTVEPTVVPEKSSRPDLPATRSADVSVTPQSIARSEGTVDVKAIADRVQGVRQPGKGEVVEPEKSNAATINPMTLRPEVKGGVVREDSRKPDVVRPDTAVGTPAKVEAKQPEIVRVEGDKRVPTVPVEGDKRVPARVEANTNKPEVAIRPDAGKTTPAGKGDTATPGRVDTTKPTVATVDGDKRVPAKSETNTNRPEVASKPDSTKTTPAVKGESTAPGKADTTKPTVAAVDGDKRAAAVDGDKRVPAKGESNTAKPESTKSTPGTKAESTKAEPTKPESTKSGTTKSESTKPESAKSEPTKSESTKSEPTKSGSIKSESTKSESTKSESMKSEQSKVDSTKAAPAAKGESTKSEAIKSESNKGTVKGDATKPDAIKGEGTKSEAIKAAAIKADTTKGAGAKAEDIKGQTAKSETTKSGAIKGEGTKAESTKGEGTKAEASKGEGNKVQGSKSESVKGNSIKGDSAKSEPTRDDNAKSESSKSIKSANIKGESGKGEAGKSENVKGESSKFDSTTAATIKGESNKSEGAKGESNGNKSSESTKSSAIKGETSKSESAKVEGTRSDSTKAAAIKGESSKSESSKVEGSKQESTKATAIKGESTKAEGAKVEATKSDSVKAATAKGDVSKPDGVNADAIKAHAVKADAAAKADSVKADAAKSESAKADAIKQSKAPGSEAPSSKPGDAIKSSKAEAAIKSSEQIKQGDAIKNADSVKQGTKDASVKQSTKESSVTGKDSKDNVAKDSKDNVAKASTKDKGSNDTPARATKDGANNNADNAQQQAKRLVSGGADSKEETSESHKHDRINKFRSTDKSDSQSESDARKPKSEKLEPVTRFAAMLRLRRDTKDQRNDKVSELKPQPEVRVQHQQRTKYIVQHGDTLASIAQKELGDARFSNLILTINRGRISMVTRNGKQEPLLHAEQVLWLPTPNEREVYAKAIFSTKNAPKHNAIEVSLMHPAHSQNPPVPSVVLERIRRANQPQSKTLHTIDLQISQSKLLDKLNTLAENVSTSVWFAGEPAGPAEQPDKKGPATQFPKFFDEAGTSTAQIEVLSPTCRVVTDKDTTTFSTTLELNVSEKWVRIACYEYRHGHGYRYSYYSNGQVKPFPMDLPLHVVLEMAREDFHRNWSSYCTEFSKQNGVARA